MEDPPPPQKKKEKIMTQIEPSTSEALLVVSQRWAQWNQGLRV